MYDEDDEEEVDYVIVGPNEANPMMGLISDQSPIGRALIGHKKGDEVTVEAPAGEYKMKILDVQRNK